VDVETKVSLGGFGHGVRRERSGGIEHADIGISLPGTFEEAKAPVYVDGKLKVTRMGDAMVADPRFASSSDHLS